MNLFLRSFSRCTWFALLATALCCGCDCGPATQPNPNPKTPVVGEIINPQPVEAMLPKSDSVDQPKSVAIKQADGNQSAPPQVDITALPFSVELQTPFTFDKVPALHSYASAQANVDGVKWLFVGGRIGGLHAFDAPTPASPANSFPRDAANDRVWVIDIANKQVWSMPLAELCPEEQFPGSQFDKYQMQASNAISCQVSDNLYIMGGYGFSPKSEATAKIQTFGTLTVMHVGAVINAVMKQQPVAVADVTQLNDPRFKVTGGELLPFYGTQPQPDDDSKGDKAAAPATTPLQLCAVFGQAFDGLYSVRISATGTLFQQRYTEQIAIFSLTETPELKLADFNTYPNINGLPPMLIDGYTYPDYIKLRPYHRRDLNVLPALSPDGKPRIGVYGGVFRPGLFESYLEPIYIDSIDSCSYEIQGANYSYDSFFPGTDHSFQQLLNQYKCASLPIYAAATKQMTTIFFGGISNYRYDAANNQLIKDPIKLAPTGRPIVDGVPFSKEITSLVVRSDNSSVGYVLPIAMPDFLGTEAELLIDPSIPQSQNGVIQLDQITEPKTIGYIYGGIRSFAPYTGEFEANAGKPVASSAAYNQFIPVVITPGNWPVKPMPAKPAEKP
jgi:hypothetical protein